MAFSLRSFFGKGGSSDGASPVAQAQEKPQAPAEPVASPFQLAATSEPGFANTLLFKTAAPEPAPSPFAAASPFAPAGDPASSGLTVADLLQSIPADVAKDPGLPPGHPVNLPEPVLESALRSGKAAVPLFEVFRACPAMFNVPVGPHDPREVALPPQKISRLIPRGAAPVTPSPFAMAAAPSPAPASPFGLVSPPPSAKPPGSAPEPVFQPSPFSFMPEPASVPDVKPRPDSPSPFSPSPAQAEAAPPANPFTPAPATTASSPFSFSADPAPPATTPFGGMTPAPAPSPFGGPVVQSMPGIGSESQDSSFFSAPAAAPMPQPAVAPPPVAPTSDFTPPSWSSIFPPQNATATTTPPASGPVGEPLPGLGTNLFSFGQPAASASNPAPAPAEPSPFAAPTLFGGEKPAAPMPATPENFGFSFPPKTEPAPTPAAATASGFESTFPAAPSKSSNPFERIQALAKAAEQAAPSVSDSFFKQPEPDTASLFGATPLPPPAPLPPPPVAAEPQPEPFPPPSFSPPPADLASTEVKLGLAASLKNCAAQDLGTNPENIPSWVQYGLPYEMLAEQLPSGRVVVPLDAIVGGLDTPIQALFFQARAGLEVELPANLVFHAVSAVASASSAPAPVAPVPAAPTAPVFTPVAEKVAPAPEPFVSLTESGWKPPVEPVSTAPAPFWEQATKPAEPKPEPETKAPFKLFLPEQKSAPEPTPPAPQVPDESVVIPANPVTGAPEFVTPAPVAPAQGQGSFAAVATPRGDQANRHLLLTVLLGTSEVADVASVVKHTRQLPGVAAVLCLNHGRSIAQSGDGSPEAERFIKDAPAKISGLNALASLTGIEDAETLHIQSGQVEATFCLEGPVTFAVLHDPRRRETMLKEKITLIGRELALMIGDSSGN